MSVKPQKAAADIKSWAIECGFDLVGIAQPRASAYAAAFQKWISAGKHGEMAFLARNIEERLDLLKKFPWARSALCVALSYWQPLENSGPPVPGSDNAGAENGLSGKIARYAWGRDYHRVMDAKLKRLEQRIRTAFSLHTPDLQIRAYCDTGPIVEREFAAGAGLGWIGKHTLLIHPQHGSWFVLGELVLSLDLTPDTPLPDHCGTCTRCIDACPTAAISSGPVRSVDARRCISYLTLEHRGDIAVEFQEPMRGAEFLVGCDICQEVCPFNGAENPQRQPLRTHEPDFAPVPPAPKFSIEKILAWQESDWDQLTRGRALRRAKFPMWQRNAAILNGSAPGGEEPGPNGESPDDPTAFTP